MAFGAPSLKSRVLKSQALRYLSQREHSRAELERKLKRWVMAKQNSRDAAGDAPCTANRAAHPDASSPAQQITATLDELTAKGLLSDARAAQSVLNSKAPRYGIRRLRQELQAKGLGAELVSATLASAQATEFERAQDIWRRKFGATAADAHQRARQMRFLAGRGFTGEVIGKVVGKLVRNASDAFVNDEFNDFDEA